MPNKIPKYLLPASKMEVISYAIKKRFKELTTQKKKVKLESVPNSIQKSSSLKVMSSNMMNKSTPRNSHQEGGGDRVVTDLTEKLSTVTLSPGDIILRHIIERVNYSRKHGCLTRRHLQNAQQDYFHILNYKKGKEWREDMKYLKNALLTAVSSPLTSHIVQQLDAEFMTQFGMYQITSGLGSVRM
jgi:mannosyltransferase OCH1-like enzyme